MAEYIEREALFRAFENAEPDIMADYGPEYGSEWGFSRDAIKEVINSLTAADVAPVVHGGWEYVCGDEFSETYKCVKCEHEFDICVEMCREELPSFCPKCGAKM